VQTATLERETETISYNNFDNVSEDEVVDTIADRYLNLKNEKLYTIDEIRKMSRERCKEKIRLYGI
jgi:hypothetical protein